MTAFGGSTAERGRRLRLGIAVGITAVAAVLLWWGGGGSSDDDAPGGGSSAPAVTEATTTSEASTPPSTTVYLVELGENWLPKESSRFSESEEAKLRRDARPDDPTTTSAVELDDGSATGSSAEDGPATDGG